MKTVGKFQLLEKLGSGGMGVVYKATDTRLRRTVALKFLSSDGSQFPASRERQLREARAAGALTHPNIATIYEIGESDDGDFIAMEFVDGDTLHNRVRGKPADLDDVMSWGCQLSAAIGAAHDIGIIHRDIKSANIMITGAGRVKVLDFGLARWGPSSEASNRLSDMARLTDSGTLLGTIDYMAPEVLRSEDATPRSDVFSIGVILFEMLTGKLPFCAVAPVQVMYSILNDDNPAAGELRPDIPADLDRVIAQAISKEPCARHATAGDLLRDLESVQCTAGQVASGAPGRPPSTPPKPRPAPIPSNLPAAKTRFIGRDKELVELERRLSNSRMLTITGPGGGGKTRVSLELAARSRCRFGDGVFLVELAPLTEDAQVIRAIARVLCAREEPGRDLIDTLIEHIGARTLLIVLDNCEHLIDASAKAAACILESAPNIKVVATSQERLGVPGEVIWHVSSLSIPPQDVTSIDELGSYESVRLFVDRATQVKSGFVINENNAAAVVQICRRLDGVPLAIELAAARVRVLPPEKILDRLEDRFRLLTSGDRTVLPRQQTLRATVEWSLELLSDSERALFRALSVFSGGMSLDGVEMVCEGLCGDDEDILDLLTRLVDKSLVVVRDASEDDPRYVMLETLREYGAAELQSSGDETAVRERHAAFVLALAEAAEPELTGPSQARWFRQLDEDAENIRSAILWLFRSAEPERALRIGSAIWRFWSVRGYLSAGRELLGVMLGAADEANDSHARALYGAGVLAMDQGDSETARKLLDECLSIRRTVEDRAGVAEALNALGIASRDSGDYPTARRYFEEGLAINRDIGDRSGIAMSIHALGITAHREGDCVVARNLFEEGLEIRKALGDRRGIAALLAHLGSVDYDLGRHEEAAPLLDEALEIFRELGNKRGIVYALMYRGGVDQQRGELAAARTSHIDCLNMARALGDKEHVARSLEWLAALAAADKDYVKAVELEAASSQLRIKFRTPRTPMQTAVLKRDLAAAHAALSSEDAERARDSGMSRSLESSIALACS